MTYTDDQIETAAKATREAFYQNQYGIPGNWEDAGLKARQSWGLVVRAALAALAAPTPAEDPDLVRWTPADGPLADALAALPDGHKVTIRDQQGQLLHGVKTTVPKLGMAPYVRTQFGTETWWLDESNSITSAEWLPPAPAWDGALVVCDGTGELFWRGPDGLYWYGAIGDSGAHTASEVEASWPPVTVLIDADGNHPDTITPED